MDGAVLMFIQNHLRADWLDGAMRFYTMLGDNGLLWIALSVLMLCFKPSRRAGFAALLAMFLGLVITNLILKILIARPRPWLDLAELLPLLEPPDPHSFPSGHTCGAFAAAGAWSRYLPRRWMKAGAVGSAVLMAYSRLYVGVHYLTDVLGGMLVGLLCAWVSVMLVEKMKKHRDLL
ncbi:hypothetical protein SDC9_170609 [bioreactor metagenome]|uniref:Phosphatidic acid phosphatase type 2/haloperoxidase domain-containing protein n=1 Tax=bioreactor metagenome TaxID=1076179 RepID=A0A645G8I2_9ZZZZ